MSPSWDNSKMMAHYQRNSIKGKNRNADTYGKQYKLSDTKLIKDAISLLVKLKSFGKCHIKA